MKTFPTSKSRCHGLAPRLSPFVLAAMLGLLVACGGSGGGGGAGGSAGGGGGGEVNEGNYSASEFGYDDPHSADFHPLGTTSRVLRQRAEIGVFPYGYDMPAGGTLDDAGTGYARTGITNQIFSGRTIVIATASGNVDDDAAHELVALTHTSGEPSYRVQVVERQPFGRYAVTASWAGVRPHADARLTVGDFDGDSRGEIAVVSQYKTSQRYIYVFDDATVGYPSMRSEVDVSISAGRTYVVAWDADDDGLDEIALVANGHIGVIDDANAGFARLVGWKYWGFWDARPFVGDLDGDRRDELGMLTSGRSSSGQVPDFSLMAFEYGSGALGRFGLTRIGSGGFVGPGTLYGIEDDFDAVAVDFDGDAVHEVATVFPEWDWPYTVAEYRFWRYRWNGATGKWDRSSAHLSTPRSSWEPTAPSLAAADTDADGADELMFGLVRGSGSRASYSVQIADPNPETGAVATSIRASGVFNGSREPEPLRLTTGDYDADGFTVATTRRTFLDVADPIPLVLMAAAPTKAGIDQNYEGSTTSYTVEATTQELYEVSSAKSYSVGQGVEIDAFGGLLSGSASVTVEQSIERSHSDAKSIGYVQSLQAGHDDDVIVFQGTLYKSYEYEVLSADDPALVGSLFTFDVPVDSKVYMWTVTRFNREFGSDHAIDSDVLTHTVGDPASYRRRSETDALVDRYVGWSFPERVEVGQGTGTRSEGIHLGTEKATTVQRSYSVTGELGFKAGIRTFTASRGLTDSSMYSVTVSDSTQYDGSVGNIRDDADYDAYQYDWGLAVYHHGVLDNGSNEPDGIEDGVIPYQVVTFWTNPVGTAY